MDTSSQGCYVGLRSWRSALVAAVALLSMGGLGAVSANAAAPEFGRCVKVAAGTGKYKTSNCTTQLAGGSFEWTTEIVNKHFTTKIKETANTHLTLNQTVTPFTSGHVQCKGETGSGEYSGTKEVTNVLLTFTGCETYHSVPSEGVAVNCEGAASGEIVLHPLEGVLGIISTTIKQGKETRVVGLDLFPPEKTGLVLGPCNGISIGVAGSVIGKVVGPDKMSVSGLTNFVAAKGTKQSPEKLEGEPLDVLEGVLAGGFPSQIGLALSMTQTSEEAVEVNAFA